MNAYYVITSVSGVLDISDNDIDCGADGNTAGGNGIYLFNDYAGARLRVSNNKIKNPTSYGIILAGAAVKPILFCEICDNKIWDDQPAATTSAAIRFVDAGSLTSIGKLILRGNSLIGGVSTMLSLGGGATGYWLVNDGEPQFWAGYGTPETVVAAVVGSMFTRLDGGSGTTLYVKQSGTGNTGWSGK